MVTVIYSEVRFKINFLSFNKFLGKRRKNVTRKTACLSRLPEQAKPADGVLDLGTGIWELAVCWL